MRQGSFVLTSVFSALWLAFSAACAPQDRQFGSTAGSGGAGGSGDTNGSTSSATTSGSAGGNAASSSSASSSSNTTASSSSGGSMGSTCQGTGAWVDISTMCGGTKKASDYCPQGQTAVSLMLCTGGESTPSSDYFTMYNFQGCPPPNGACPTDASHVSWAAICCK